MHKSSDKEGADMIRRDIKRAVANRTLLPGRYSVRVRRGAFCAGAEIEYGVNVSLLGSTTMREQIFRLTRQRLELIASRYDRSAVDFTSLDSSSDSYPYYSVERNYGRETASEHKVTLAEAELFLKSASTPRARRGTSYRELLPLLKSKTPIAKLLADLDALGFVKLTLADGGLSKASLDHALAARSAEREAEWLRDRYDVEVSVRVQGQKLLAFLKAHGPLANEGEYHRCLQIVRTILASFNTIVTHESGISLSPFPGGEEVVWVEAPGDQSRKHVTERVVSGLKIGDYVRVASARGPQAAEPTFVREAVVLQVRDDELLIAFAVDPYGHDDAGVAQNELAALRFLRRGNGWGQVIVEPRTPNEPHCLRPLHAPAPETLCIVERLSSAKSLRLVRARMTAPKWGDPGDIPVLALDVLPQIRKGQRVDVTRHELYYSSVEGGVVADVSKTHITVRLDRGEAVAIPARQEACGKHRVTVAPATGRTTFVTVAPRLG